MNKSIKVLVNTVPNPLNPVEQTVDVLCGFPAFTSEQEVNAFLVGVGRPLPASVKAVDVELVGSFPLTLGELLEPLKRALASFPPEDRVTVYNDIMADYCHKCGKDKGSSDAKNMCLCASVIMPTNPEKLITVANVRVTPRTADLRLYCGRGQAPKGLVKADLGNPFHVGSVGWGPAIAKFEGLLLGESPGSRRWRVIHRIALRVREGKSVQLFCWCSPAPCHCDFIREQVLKIIHNIPIPQ